MSRVASQTPREGRDSQRGQDQSSAGANEQCRGVRRTCLPANPPPSSSPPPEERGNGIGEGGLSNTDALFSVGGVELTILQQQTKRKKKFQCLCFKKKKRRKGKQKIRKQKGRPRMTTRFTAWLQSLTSASPTTVCWMSICNYGANKISHEILGDAGLKGRLLPDRMNLLASSMQISPAPSTFRPHRPPHTHTHS